MISGTKVMPHLQLLGCITAQQERLDKMNTQTYEQYSATVPSFKAKECKMVDPKSIFVDAEINQTRTGGHVRKNVPKFKTVILEKIKNGTLKTLPPVSVSPFNSTEFDFEAVDGATRLLAYQELADDPDVVAELDELGLKVEAWVSDYWARTFKPSGLDWIEYQAIQNDHYVAESNSKSDIAAQIATAHKNGEFVKRFGITYNGNEKEYTKMVTDWVRSIHKNSGFKIDTDSSFIKTGLAGAVTKFWSVSPTLAAQTVANTTTLAWNGEGSGKIAMNQQINVFGDANKFLKFATTAWESKVKNPNVDFYAIGYVDDLVGLSEELFDKRRAKMLEKYDAFQKHVTVDGKPLFAGMYFVAQKLQCKVNETIGTLIKVR